MLGKFDLNHEINLTEQVESQTRNSLCSHRGDFSPGWGKNCQGGSFPAKLLIFTHVDVWQMLVSLNHMVIHCLQKKKNLLLPLTIRN